MIKVFQLENYTSQLPDLRIELPVRYDSGIFKHLIFHPVSESHEHYLFSKTLPASKSDESKSLKELLDKQQAAIAKANSQPSLLELIEENKVGGTSF